MDTTVLSPVALFGGTGMILVALGFVVYALVRRLSVGYLLLGALAWVVTVAVKFALAIAFNQGIYTALTDALPGGIGLGLFDVYVGLLTGLTEVLLVWLVMRYTRLGRVDWKHALAFGIGFGAVEALLLGLGSAATVSVALLAPQSIPSAALAQLAVLNDPLYALAPIVERFFTIWVHIFCNVLILFGVARMQSRGFWLAFVFKSALDAFAAFGQLAGMTGTVEQIWVLEAGVILCGIVSWLGVRWVAAHYGAPADTAPDAATGGASRTKAAVIAVIVLLLAAGFGVVGISLAQAPAPLSADNQESVLAYAEAQTDNLVAGLCRNDYAAFSRDLDAQVKNTLTPAQFANVQERVIGKIGHYVSRRVNRVEQSGDMVTVVYTAKFENDDPVTVRLVFHAVEPHQIAGLWFDSPKLRE